MISVSPEKTIVGYFGRICSKGSFERFFDGAFLRRCPACFRVVQGKAEIDATETKGGKHDRGSGLIRPQSFGFNIKGFFLGFKCLK